MKIALILPAYNEELTIKGTIEAFWKCLPNSEIWVINNNSKDKTEIIAKETLSQNNIKGGVLNEWRQGKGNAVRRAFHSIDADIFVMSDADLTYPADKALELISFVADGEFDMVVGDRLSGGHYQNENKRAFHSFGNNLVRILINQLFSANLNDIMSGYRVFSRRFVKNYPILVEGFQIETDLTLHALDKRFRIKEVVIDYKDRPEGSFSKLNTFRDGARVLLTIVSILRHYRPLLFFGGIGIIFGLFGLLSATPVFQDWIQFRYIYHVPLAVLAVAFEIVAAISIGVGLILDSIVHQNKMNFEKSLLSYSK